MMDNAESIHQRLLRDHDIDHTLKDIMVWREEEILATGGAKIVARMRNHLQVLRITGPLRELQDSGLRCSGLNLSVPWRDSESHVWLTPVGALHLGPV